MIPHPHLPNVAIVEDSDITKAFPPRNRESHKWQTAVFIAAGSPGMVGAAILAAQGAQRAGAGMVRLAVPGVKQVKPLVVEAVSVDAIAADWSSVLLDDISRAKALVVGPGLGRTDEVQANVRKLVKESDCPLVLDADALWALSEDPDDLDLLVDREAETVLTPHDREFERLSGVQVGENRIADAQGIAERTGSTVLLKGSTTYVAAPGGQVLVSQFGSPRLATAGTGDVLSGVIGAFLAQGLDGLQAAALGAHVHATAALLGRSRGLVAGDLPSLIADRLSELCDD